MGNLGPALPAQIRKLPENYLASEVDGELILIHGESGAFFSIRDIGLDIWNLIDDCGELGPLCSRLAGQFEVDPLRCEAEVHAFTRELVEAGLAEFA